MNTHFVAKIVSHKFNGNEVQVETVEVDGKKYVADDADKTKPKLDDKKQPILYVEKKADDIKIEDYTKAELADLAKINPHVAKLLDDQKKRDDADEKAKGDKKKADEEEAKKKGDWQKLADERGTELESTKGTLKEKTDMLAKYVEMTDKVLKGITATIPKENLGLIPEEFSPRQKLEYIIANGARLGAKVNSIDGKFDKNEIKPEGTDEDKMVKQIAELSEKATKRTATNAELQQLREVGSKLTQLRREKEAKK